MRIGMLTDWYTPHTSGVTHYISLNKRALERAGNEVYVFTFSEEGHTDQEPNIVRSPSLPVLLPYLERGLALGVRYNKEARALLESMDVVHVNQPFLSGTLALRYCRPHNIPIVFTNHTRYDLYVQAYLPQIPDGVGKVFLEAYLPTFCRACDLVIAPSGGMRDVMQAIGVHTPIEVIPNGVNLEPFRSAPGRLKRQELGFDPGQVLLVYAGRLGPEKNLSFLLRCFAGAAQAYENLGLLLVGDGPERDNLEDRVKYMGIGSKVRFVGQTQYERMPDYLQLADIFVTASVTEVHPLSVIEAMAAGLPVLGVASPGVGDTVVEGVSGYLAREDLAEFTAKLVRLATEPDLRRMMGQNARVAAETYGIGRTSATLLERYRQLAEARSSRQRGLRALVRRLMPRRLQ
jgi:glycosyltransferase involved in cell wall biosynthesis